MMREPLRVAQLSFWFIHAEQFCLAAPNTPGVELVAAWDSDAERGSRRAAYSGVPFYEDFEALLERDDIDAVSLCTEPFRHPEFVEPSLPLGYPEEAKKIMVAAERSANRDGKRVYLEVL